MILLCKIIVDFVVCQNNEINFECPLLHCDAGICSRCLWEFVNANKIINWLKLNWNWGGMKWKQLLYEYNMMQCNLAWINSVQKYINVFDHTRKFYMFMNVLNCSYLEPGIKICYVRPYVSIFESNWPFKIFLLL